jgi:hypothetical protein
MSYAETQQIMADLKEIMALIDGVTIKTEKINSELPRTQESLASMRQLERLALRYLTITKKMGMPDDIQGQIQIISQLIVTVRMLQISYAALTSSTPLGILMGIGGFILSGLTLYDSMEGY